MDDSHPSDVKQSLARRVLLTFPVDGWEIQYARNHLSLQEPARRLEQWFDRMAPDTIELQKC